MAINEAIKEAASDLYDTLDAVEIEVENFDLDDYDEGDGFEDTVADRIEKWHRATADLKDTLVVLSRDDEDDDEAEAA
jgi:hypothetical protein